MIQEYIEKHQLNHYFHTNRIYKAYDFLQFLRDLNLKLEYIKSGSTGHCFKAFNESYSCAIKVVAYSDQHKDKYGDILFLFKIFDNNSLDENINKFYQNIKDNNDFELISSKLKNILQK